MLAKTRSVLVWSLVGTATVSSLALGSCDAKLTSAPVLPFFDDVLPLTAAEVQLILDRAVAAIDSPFLHVAVVDRTGEILGALRTTPAGP
ncbi:MAG TPA: hypothetical protein VFT55_06155, partial [Planctomycetota bacterium]|nr:hypothetical protein [Planctomycetota bacterium]